ncbi:MAG TPA: hypothetical protein VGR92_16310 [Steroidobacteraceae bacterium]|nr:hypothetical protein [Steroidobacteraceae bacterium]
MPSLIALFFTLASAAGYAALTVAGALLWRRRGSAAGAVIAIGFALALLDQVSRLVEYLELRALLRGHAADTLFIIHHHALLQCAALLGLWVAAAGLVWHAARARGAGAS